MYKNRIQLNKFIITLIISLIFFYTVDINFNIYFFIVLTLWLLVFLNYNIKTNLPIFDTLIIVGNGNFIAYILVKKMTANNIFESGFSEIWIILYILFLLIISIYIDKLYNSSDKNQQKRQKIMYKRKADLQRLSDYLNSFNIVGVNGKWGDGKSFLVDELKETIRDEYEIIEIDILTCNLDELQLSLIKELEKVMNKNRIFSKYSNKLKDFLTDQTIISKLHSLIFTESSSYSEIIKGFQNDLSKINKKILIIYEDIDRISEKSEIEKIFGVSEKLSNEKIKIIYQYDEKNLEEIGFTSDYLEKYIPFKMNLTEIKFFEILNFVFEDNDLYKSLFSIKDFEILNEHAQNYRYNVLNEEFGINKQINLIISYVSIRKVKHFLDELCNAIVKEKYKDYKEIVISFFFIKHFIPSAYELLNIESGLIETFNFKVDSNEYNITELIRMYKSKTITQCQIEELFEIDDNKMKYCILKLFDFSNEQFNEEKEEADVRKRIKLIMEEPGEKLKNKNYNDKKDRLIWSLLANGKSNYTDYEYVGNKLINEVLDKPEESQEQAYNKFCNSLFHNNSEKQDNKTIFLVGVSAFIELFKSFRILGVTDEHQIGLVNLYLKKEKIHEIKTELIQALNYCNLSTNKEYIYILKRINNLNVVGNLNSEKCFVDFLKKYIGALSNLGYINTIDYFNIHGVVNINEHKAQIVHDLEKVKTDIGNLKNKLSTRFLLEIIDDELETIIQFSNKLIEIISCNSLVDNVKKSQFKTEWSSMYTNQNEIDRLKKVADNNGDFKEEMKKSYLDGKITVYEINKLLDSFERNI